MERGLGLLQTILQPVHLGPPGGDPLGRARVVPVATSGHCSGGGELVRVEGVAMTTIFEGLPRLEY